MLIRFQHSQFDLSLLVTCRGNLLGLGIAAFDCLKVLKLKLCVDDLLVADRIDSTVNMGDIVIFKAPEDMNDSICLTDVAKKLVSQTLTLAGTLYQACYIYYITGSRHDAPWVNYFCKIGKTIIRNGDNTYIRFYSTEREICCLSLCR